MDDKFTVCYGEIGGSKQLRFFYANKVNMAELMAKIEQEFSETPLEKLNVLPGYVCCTITTGKDLEVPST